MWRIFVLQKFGYLYSFSYWNNEVNGEYLAAKNYGRFFTKPTCPPQKPAFCRLSRRAALELACVKNSLCLLWGIKSLRGPHIQNLEENIKLLMYNYTDLPLFTLILNDSETSYSDMCWPLLNFEKIYKSGIWILCFENFDRIFQLWQICKLPTRTFSKKYI